MRVKYILLKLILLLMVLVPLRLLAVEPFADITLTSNESTSLAPVPATDLAADNSRLISETQSLIEENRRLRGEVSELRQNGAQKWFMAGAAALALGVILGLVLHGLGGRRRSQW